MNSASWQLDNRLEQDTHRLGYMDTSMLLLMKNAIFPWFVIVPRTIETEFFQLSAAMQSELLQQINQISAFIDSTFTVDKINIATIGNLVSQFHAHVVGRSEEDPCWPGVVWGCEAFKAYELTEVERIRNQLLEKGLITSG